MAQEDLPAPPVPRSRTALTCAVAAVAIIPINTLVGLAALEARDGALPLVLVLALAQFVLGIAALIAGIRQRRATGKGGIGPAVVGVVAAIGAPAGVALEALGMFASAMGGAWGRPLRIRGRQRHPELREGSDWTRGPRPDPAGLDEPTRRALTALWLHDAQKEHASVPAFARVSWLLAAVGAPADLLEGAHRAGIEEIDHTRVCFALAAGYGGRSHTVEPMPELLLADLGQEEDPRVTLAIDSLSDGCQLEDFNADVAAECARACEDPATRAALDQIAREERSHADLSWSLLGWLLDRHRAAVAPAVERALAALDGYPRPTAVSDDKRALVDAADPQALRRHGRLPDERWAAIWDARLSATRRRARALLDEGSALRAA